MKLTLLLSTAACWGMCINAGGPTTFEGTGGVRCFGETGPAATRFYTGTSEALVDPLMGADELADLRRGPTFTYKFPTVPGFYRVDLAFVEPNIVPYARIFTVTVNGAATQDINVSKAVGPRAPYVLRLFAVSNGVLQIDFAGKGGTNAIVSMIDFNLLSPADMFDIVRSPNLKDEIRDLYVATYTQEMAMPPLLRAPFFSGDMNPVRRAWIQLRDRAVIVATDDDYKPLILTH